MLCAQCADFDQASLTARAAPARVCSVRIAQRAHHLRRCGQIDAMQDAPAATAADERLKCSGVDCDKTAGTLACPTCLKLGIKPSRFCDQDCFKRSWTVHKAVHWQAQQSVIVNGVESEWRSMRSGGILKVLTSRYILHQLKPTTLSHRASIPELCERATRRTSYMYIETRRTQHVPADCFLKNPRDPSQRRHVPAHIPRPNYADTSAPFCV